jgi:hypothetical protein
VIPPAERPPPHVLVAELRPHYRQLSEAMRGHPPCEGNDDGGEVIHWDSGGSHGAAPAPLTDPGQINFDGAGLGAFDAAGFDFAAFDASVSMSPMVVMAAAGETEGEPGSVPPRSTTVMEE